MNQVDAILAADLHLREDQPECRTDDYWKAQARAMKSLRELQKEHDCPICIAGDIFNHWKISPFLAAWSIIKMPKQSICIPGQHDLPQHNLELMPKAGLQVLKAAKVAQVLRSGDKIDCGPSSSVYGYGYGEDVSGSLRKSSNRRILLTHQLVWHLKKPFPGCSTDSAMKLLRKHSAYDLILTGDNHQPFVVEDKGRLLVNPGSLMRMRADQIDHKPRVYLWNAKRNEVEPVFLPIKKSVISRAHIDKKKERDKRLESFVERLGDEFEVGLSFEDNLKKYFEENKTSRKVKEMIMEVVG